MVASHATRGVGATMAWSSYIDISCYRGGGYHGLVPLHRHIMLPGGGGATMAWSPYIDRSCYLFKWKIFRLLRCYHHNTCWYRCICRQWIRLVCITLFVWFGGNAHSFRNAWFHSHWGVHDLTHSLHIDYILLNLSVLWLCYKRINDSGLFAWISLTALSWTYSRDYDTIHWNVVCGIHIHACVCALSGIRFYVVQWVAL